MWKQVVGAVWSRIWGILQGIGLALELDIGLDYVELDFEVDVELVVAVVEVSDSIASGSVLTRTALFDDRVPPATGRILSPTVTPPPTPTLTIIHPTWALVERFRGND